MNKDIKYCECGCGGIPKISLYNCKKTGWIKGEYRRFISGHNNRGVKFTQEHKDNLSKANKGNLPWCAGKKLPQEMKDKIRKSNIGKIFTKEHRKNLSIVNSVPKPYLRGKKRSIECRKKQSEKRKELFRSGYKHPMIGKHFSDEAKLKSSIAHKKIWLNPEFVDKWMKAKNITPNKPETIILNILNHAYPNEWKYTGDFSFMINGKNPDFVNCNGQKKIIELYGDYWHKGDSEQDRIDTFAPFGYQTLIIWEKELKNINKVINKITTFCNGNTQSK